MNGDSLNKRGRSRKERPLKVKLVNYCAAAFFISISF